MAKLTPIQEYYLCSRERKPSVQSDTPVSNEDLRKLLTELRYEQQQHLDEQDLLLQVIQNQSRPQFGREFLANLTANAVWDGLIFVGSKIFKL